ncbi:MULTISPECIES: hypothetical protein [Gracilimonas]|uniref:hypothetical protein n=1 Tax=Gracilimonas TaxID=649462 RepID=UPI001B2D6196|nr:hypothetical protein [Gracilimonas sp.]MBO6615614.1 hypothetical protein [Gracilimonas sp.]
MIQVYSKIVLLGFTIFLFLSIQNAMGQVVIKDKLEIKPNGQKTHDPGIESAVSGPFSFYYPVFFLIFRTAWSSMMYPL